MAKKKGSHSSSQNKSLAIRQYKSDHPAAKPKEIARELTKQGYQVTPQYVSTILSNERRKAGGSSVALFASANFSVDDLYLAKQLVSNTGSIKAAHQAIDCYSQLLT